MGQQLFKVNFERIDSTATNGPTYSLHSDTMRSCIEEDKISFLSPWKIDYLFQSSIEPDKTNQLSNSQNLLIKQIRTNLFQLTHSKDLKDLDTEINQILVENILSFIENNYQKAMKEMKDNWEKQQQLQKSLINQLKQEEDENTSIFALNEHLSSTNSDDNQQKLSYFALQSLISILLILIKSAEKNDSTIIYQILSLTSQLAEQIPIKCLSSINHQTFLFKSLKPLIHYIEQLSSSSDLILSKQATKILLSLSIGKASFKDILPLLSKLIFDTKNIYDTRTLIIQLNNNLTQDENTTLKESTDQISVHLFDYLKSIGAFPNTKLMELDAKQLTGQFISSIILAHIHFDQFNSFSFEFHPTTFKQLFNIIQQLLAVDINHSNTIINHILIVCVRLFTEHLKVLSDSTTNLYQNLLSTSDESQLKLKTLLSNEELLQWFELFLPLSSSDHQNSETKIVCEEASKILVHIINQQTKSFTEKLSLIHKYLIENEYQLLIKEFLLELNKEVILFNWIDVILNNNLEKAIALEILYSFLEIYFNTNQEQIKQILLTFQHLLIFKLVEQSRQQYENEAVPSTSISTLFIDYITYIFNKCPSENQLFDEILVGLSLMTKTEDLFHFTIIQPIFTAVLPLLSEYLLKNPQNNPSLIYWLLGKMSEIMLISSPLNSLEKKYFDQLNSPLFSGGCETPNIETSSDHQLLMSIYNNTNEGAKLISKIKMSLKTKQHFLQKSIEEQANEACAAIFAVYIKYYRRINLVRSDLSRSDNEKVHPHLLSLYKYASGVQTFFIKIKGQDGDCTEVYHQIKTKSLFLLLSIKENDFIPIIEEEIIEKKKDKFHLQRQISHWTKAKHVIRLLRNLMNACIRFKKLMLNKQKNSNYQTILHQAIHHFIYQTNDQKIFNLEELKICLDRQNQRAMNRLFTYQFIHNLFNMNEARKNLILYLPPLGHCRSEWSYLENLPSANNHLKNEIRKSFYSMIKLLLFSFLKSPSEILLKNLFHLLNFNYQSADISYLYNYQIMEIFFQSFVSYTERTISLELKFLAFNWFRLFTLKLCEHVHFEEFKGSDHQTLQKQRNLIFNKFLLHELKGLQQIIATDANNEDSINSLEYVTFAWFLQSTKTVHSKRFSSTLEIELYLNQYLVLVLECICLYEHVRASCANMDYIEELLNIYHRSKHNTTIVLTLKILGQLISYLPNNSNEILNNLIEKFLVNSLISIGESLTSQQDSRNITHELINVYRTILSRKSSWQMLAIQLLLNSLHFSFNETSVESKKLIASLCILGGDIQPFSLASIVKVFNNKEKIDQVQLAIIIGIDSSSYVIQYLETNQTESVTSDQLQTENDLLPPNLLSFPNANESIHSIFDRLGEFIQMDCPTPLLLEIKRRSISAFHHLLNNQKLIEIFLQKPYASSIAKLTISQSAEQPIHLSLFNKERLEQYYLTLKKTSTISSIPVIRDENLVQSLSTSVWKYNGWKAYASKLEIQLLNQGRWGNNQMSIVPMPLNTANAEALQECGNKHRFKGRIFPTTSNTTVRFPSFILDNCRVSEGKWYFCVKLPVGGLVQIGWATDGFSPGGSRGIGDDLYSWSYDGSRSVVFHNQEFPFNTIRWKENDVCGCGIDINGEDIHISYWLNGTFLGTPFSHQQNILSSTNKCNLLPNGPTTTFFPGLTVQAYCSPSTTSEFIFSPEDMINCPLPYGYKPLLMPELVQTENSIVAYPYSAYLVGKNVQEYFYQTRMTTSKTFLRDFVNEDHLQTEFTVDEHELILPETSPGFPLSIDETSFTITFDFHIRTEEPINLQLLTFDALENLSIRVPLDKITETTRTVIVFQLIEHQIKVHINSQCHIFNMTFANKTISKLHLHLLPKIDAKISNLGIWKYALLEEHIQRLFTYGLFYVSSDYQQLKEYQNRVNTFTFTDHHFESELLVPFDQPFENEIWEKKKKQAEINESKYFQSSTIQFYGNQTYLVLDKSKEQYSAYTLILDISIPNCPIESEQLSLVNLNSKAQICVTHEGKLCLKEGETTMESNSPFIFNEYVRLFISVERKSLKVYVNGSLEIDISINDDRFTAKLNRFDLFRETDRIKNTTNDEVLRIQCQSITFLNRSMAIIDLEENMKLPNSSLEKLVAPPFSLISGSLIAIGYKPAWIKSVLEQSNIRNIQMVDTILRQQKEQLIKTDLDNEQKRYLNIFSRLNPSIDHEKLNNWLRQSELITDEQIEFILTHWKDFQTNNEISGIHNSSNKTEVVSEENNWFLETVHHLDIQQNINEWIRDKSTMTKSVDNNTPILTTNRVRSLFSWLRDEDEEEEEEEESETPDFFRMLLTSRQEQSQSQPFVNANSPGDIVYKLFDLNQSEQNQNQQLLIRKSLEFSPKQSFSSPVACEHALTTIYARYTIDNMLKIWSNNSIILFPLHQFGDYTLLVTLIRIMDYHFICKNLHTNENTNHLSLLIKSILKFEIEQVLENNPLLSLESTAPLFSHLQNHILVQLIRFLIEPSLLDDTSEQILCKQPNWDFVFKILEIFLELVREKSILKAHQIDVLVQCFFPECLINLLFDLFLLVPTHRPKIFILHLFSTLIQTSEHFILKIHIQHFLFKLLIELSSNLTSTKQFQMAVMDLVYLLLIRVEKQEVSFPENVQNLFTAIDVINAFLDQRKEKVLPQAFLSQLEDISNDGIKLNRNDFETCNSHFDNITDQELLSLMNTHPSLENSFAAFIHSLPEEFLPNSIYYQKYRSLSNIPIELIQLRSEFLYQLNIFITKILPMIDLNLLIGESFLTDQIRTAKIYLLRQTKFQLLTESLEKTAVKHAVETPRVSFDPIKASESKENSENTMFYQAYQQLHSNAHIHFRKKERQIWQAIYVGMHSTDQGGPYRDSITQICSDICSIRLPLFILCPNGRTDSGSNRDCWIPNVFPPNKPIPNELKEQYQFVGQLMGMAIRRKHYLDFKFPPLLWKQLLREVITIEDIQAIDLQSFTSVNEMEKNIEQTTSIDVSDIFSSIISELRFEVVSSAGETYELVPGGRDIPITSQNLKQYLSCYRQYRLQEFHRQIEFIRQGLCSIVPFYFLSFLTPNELGEAVCGKGQIDIELLKRNTQYNESYREDSPNIQRFWTVIDGMFNDEQKKLFLTFVWGRNTLPSRDEDFTMKFTINQYHLENTELDKALPRSHTCGFALDLPEYSTTEIMYERLNYAITYCSSIDGDGNLNGELRTINLFSDSDE